MDSDPFAPPEDRSTEGFSGAIVVAIWVLSGAALSSAIGAALVVMGLAGSIVGFGVSGAGAAAVVGLVAVRLERQSALSRPLLVDGKGRLVRPLATWVVAVPMLGGTFGVFGLVLLYAARIGSSLPVLVFGTVVLCGAILARPFVAARALTRAVEALESGDTTVARARLLSLVGARWVPKSAKMMAALNLGFLALTDGDFETAAEWYQQAGKGRSNAYADTGLALIRTLQARWPEAEELLSAASVGSAGRLAQAEIDGVRLLLALRRDGPVDARALGEQLYGPGAGGLFLAVLAACRKKTGDEAAALELLADSTVEDTLQSALGEWVVEIRELRFSVRMGADTPVPAR